MCVVSSMCVCVCVFVWEFMCVGVCIFSVVQRFTSTNTYHLSFPIFSVFVHILQPVCVLVGLCICVCLCVCVSVFMYVCGSVRVRGSIATMLYGVSVYVCVCIACLRCEFMSVCAHCACMRVCLCAV